MGAVVATDDRKVGNKEVVFWTEGSDVGLSAGVASRDSDDREVVATGGCFGGRE